MLADQNDQQSTDLVVFEEQNAHLAQYPQQIEDALKEIGQDLQAWYEAAEKAGDTAAMTAIPTLYSRAEQLASIAVEQQDKIVWLVTVATNLKNQRDHVTGEYTDLVEAIDTADTEHPKVAEIFEIAWENALEELGNDCGFDGSDEGIHTDTPGQDVEDNGHLPGIDANTAEQFLELVFGYTDELSPEMYGRLATFINEFTAESRAYFKAEHERRMREAAEFTALMQHQKAVTNGR